MNTSHRLDLFPEYIFSRLSKEVKKVEGQTGKKALNLSVGSPDFPPSKIYIEKLKEYIDDPGSYLYPGYGATALFSSGLKSWYKKRFQVELGEDELFPLFGAKDAVTHLPLALTDEGDEILIPDPGYPAFAKSIVITGVSVIPYTLFPGDSFAPTFAEIEKKITPKTKMIWINFPSNPTGQIITLAELKPLVSLCKNNNIWLIYDNAYAEMTYDGYIAPSILEIPNAKEITIEVGSFSKMYSLAGYRMGWIVGNSQAIAALAKVKSQVDSGLSLPLQQMGGYALLHPDETWRRNMIQNYRTKRDLLIGIFRSLGLSISIPKGGLYLWAQIPEDYVDSYEYSLDLLTKRQIVVTPGLAFGANGSRFVRISFCSDITNLSSYI